MDKNKMITDIDSIAADLAEDIGSEKVQDPSRSLLPPGAEKEKLKNEIVQSLNTYFTQVSNGVNHLLDRLEKLVDEHNPNVDRTVYEEVINKLSDQNLEGFNEEELKNCLVAAIDMYNHQEYDHAADAFYVLTVLAPTRPLFWKCLGNAKFFSQNYKDAFDAYAMALKLNPHDPECFVYQARCLQKEGRESEAIDLLQQATEVIGQDPQFESWKEKVTDLIQELKNRR